MSALGALFGGGGGDPSGGPDAGGAGGGSDPDQLLQQIIQLMQQYLTLGESTPAFQPVSEALPAIEQAMGGGAPTDSEGGGDMASEPGGEPPSEGSPMDTMQPSSPPSSFGDASSMALDALKKRKGKAF